MTPATLGQASLYFAEAWQERDGAYNMTISAQVCGPVSDQRLADGCRNLYQATAALRLRVGIDARTGGVCSWFDDGEPDIEYRDRRGASRAALAALADNATQRPFETDEGPMTRFVIVRTGPGTATLQLVFHHLVCDGVGVTELGERLVRCVTEELPRDDGHSYASLVDQVRATELAAQRDYRDYWRARIAPGIEVAGLPRANGEVHAPSGSVTFRLGRRAVAALDATAAAAGSSRFRLMIASIHQALPESGAAVSVVCTAASQRPPGPAGQRIVGCFINQVPLLATRRDGDTAATIAAREDAGWREDLRRRYFPFTDLARRAESAARLDSVMVGYRSAPPGLRRRVGAVTCSADLINRLGAPKTELQVRFFDHGAQALCEVEWGDGLATGVGQRFAATLADQVTGSSACAESSR